MQNGDLQFDRQFSDGEHDGLVGTVVVIELHADKAVLLDIPPDLVVRLLRVARIHETVTPNPAREAANGFGQVTVAIAKALHSRGPLRRQNRAAELVDAQLVRRVNQLAVVFAPVRVAVMMKVGVGINNLHALHSRIRGRAETPKKCSPVHCRRQSPSPAMLRAVPVFQDTSSEGIPCRALPHSLARRQTDPQRRRESNIRRTASPLWLTRSFISSAASPKVHPNAGQ